MVQTTRRATVISPAVFFWDFLAADLQPFQFYSVFVDYLNYYE